MASWFHPESWLGTLLLLVAFAVMAALASRLLRAAVRVGLRRGSRTHIDRTAVQFLQQLGSIFIWAFAMVAFVRMVPALAELGTALLAGVSVASVVIGLAAQSTLGNLISGVALLIYRPFEVGDRLQVSAPTGLETGVVESISLGYTVLVTSDRRRITISNSSLANQTTINLRDVPLPK